MRITQEEVQQLIKALEIFLESCSVGLPLYGSRADNQQK